jgi:hypothetical protein
MKQINNICAINAYELNIVANHDTKVNNTIRANAYELNIVPTTHSHFHH